MRLFCFASKTEENIRRGIEARKWAVATVSDGQMRTRKTKARRYFKVGDCGLLYCNPSHAFTTPFIVKSSADPNATVIDIWPEPWVLPFEIEPLGNLDNQLASSVAPGRWPFLAKRLGPRGGVSAAMNITGTTVFSPVEIEVRDWDLILEDLGAPSRT